MQVVDFAKDLFYAGIGMAVETRDKVETFAKDMVEKNQMSAEEGKKFVADVKDRYDKTQAKLEAKIEGAVKDVLKKVDVATADEIKALKKEIRDLKDLINEKLK